VYPRQIGHIGSSAIKDRSRSIKEWRIRLPFVSSAKIMPEEYDDVFTVIC
jgi:hypothetical protein